MKRRVQCARGDDEDERVREGAKSFGAPVRGSELVAGRRHHLTLLHLLASAVPSFTATPGFHLS